MANRMSTLFAFGGDRSRSKSPGPAKTLSKSRDPSPAANQSRKTSAKLRSTKSSQHLKPGSVDLDSRGRQPSGQPRLSALMSNLPAGTATDVDLMPPPPIAGFGERTSSPTGSHRSSILSRPASSAGSIPGSRPASPGGELRPVTPTEGKLTKRMSWFPGGSSKNGTRAASGQGPAQTGKNWAFVVGPSGKSPYDTASLIKFEPVAEIWDDEANMFVHFLDKASGVGPSFKIHSELIAHSKKLTGQAVSNVTQEEDITGKLQNVSMSQGTGSRPGSAVPSRSSSPDTEKAFPAATLDSERDGLHLYLNLESIRNDKEEVTSDGLEVLIRVRNLFAFLVGQVLIGDPHMHTLFQIFYTLGGLLKNYQFSNVDSSTLGEAPLASFLGYTDDLLLADVRQSREKTLEALVLGERMKCWPLYNEAYVHAVGKWDELVRLRTPVMVAISDTTRTRLEKSARDLESRLIGTKIRLERFEFPSLFTGILASANTARAGVEWKSWKNAWVTMRNHIIQVYKTRYGSWPPKAKSKKNDFDISGLNRIVALEMYQDFCDLYDMMVDRTNLTPRTVDDTAEDLSPDPSVSVLRRFMSEFDRSSPPVVPPVPYDVPLFPTPADVNRDFKNLNTRKQVKERSKRPKDDDINRALMQAYNRDSIKVTPFTEAFMAYERSAARGKTWHEISELRVGQWIFVYVIIQSLPLLAMDAPNLRWTEGVEYFLCEVPKGTPPWVDETRAPTNAYYRVAGTGGYVSMPSDVVDYGVDGIYHRSHCWLRAKEWSPDQSFANNPTEYLPDTYQSDSGYTSQGQYPQQHPQQYPQDPMAPGDDGYPHSDYHSSGRGPPSIPALNTGIMSSPPPGVQPGISPYGELPPPGVAPFSRTDSPGNLAPPSPGGGLSPGTPGADRRSSMALGLEALPMPPKISADDMASRRLSTPDPSKTFEAFLGNQDQGKKKKKW